MALAPTGPALSLLLVSIVLLVISCITVALRVMVRLRINGFGTDDWLMVIGLVFFAVACVSTSIGSFNGVGTADDRLTPYYDIQGRKWFMFFQLFYVLSTVPIKCSICVALLRITTRPLYRWILRAVMFLATVACIVTDVAVLAQCRPIAATWDPSLGECADPAVITGVSFFISAVSILTDWTCAILPAFILWDVQLRFRIKASVAVVLGLGVVASTATLVRLKYLSSYTASTNYLLNIAPVGTWSIVESGVGLIAGSLATLRALLRHVPFLRDFIGYSGNSGSGPTGGTTAGGGGRSKSGGGATTAGRSRTGRSSTHYGPGSISATASRGGGKITATTTTTIATHSTTELRDLESLSSGDSISDGNESPPVALSRVVTGGGGGGGGELGIASAARLSRGRAGAVGTAITAGSPTIASPPLSPAHFAYGDVVRYEATAAAAGGARGGGPRMPPAAAVTTRGGGRRDAEGRGSNSDDGNHTGWWDGDDATSERHILRDGNGIMVTRDVVTESYEMGRR